MEKGNRINKISEWVILSKAFFILASVLLIGSSIITLGLFVSTNDNISTNEWLRLIFTDLGSLFATLGILMVNRGSKNFYYFSLTGAFLLFVNGIISQLFFDAIKWLLIGTILLIQTIYWLRSLDKIKIKKWNIWIVLLTILILFISSFLIGKFGVSKIPEESFFYNKSPVLDPIQSTFSIAGNLMMLFIIIESRFVFLIGNVLTLYMFASIVGHGDYISTPQLVQAILYTLITISGYINIRNNYNQNEKDRWQEIFDKIHRVNETKNTSH